MNDGVEKRDVEALRKFPGFIKAEHDGEDWECMYDFGGIEMSASGDWKHMFMHVARSGYTLARNTGSSAPSVMCAINIFISSKNDHMMKVTDHYNEAVFDKDLANRARAVIDPWLCHINGERPEYMRFAPGVDMDAIVQAYLTELDASEPDAAVEASRDIANTMQRMRTVMHPLFSLLKESPYASDSIEMSERSRVIKELRSVGYNLDVSTYDIVVGATYHQDGLRVSARSVNKLMAMEVRVEEEDEECVFMAHFSGNRKVIRAYEGAGHMVRVIMDVMTDAIGFRPSLEKMHTEGQKKRKRSD